MRAPRRRSEIYSGSIFASATILAHFLVSEITKALSSSGELAAAAGDRIAGLTAAYVSAVSSIGTMAASLELRSVSAVLTLRTCGAAVSSATKA